jgi:hypothetical protein
LARVTVVWRRELGGLAVNWTDILDGEIVNAAWAVAGMAARPRTARRVAASLDTAAWADTERLIRDVLKEITADPELPELTEDEAAELAAAVPPEFNQMFRDWAGRRVNFVKDRGRATGRRRTRPAPVLDDPDF